MKIISWNVNGLRSINNKGFSKWFSKTNPDILCLQEIKCQELTLPFKLSNYHCYYNYADKLGYSGVAVFTKEKPKTIHTKLGFTRFDSEGRMVLLEFRKFILINFYLPHGGRMKEKLDYKLEVYKNVFKFLKKYKDKKLILVGDFNIAHKEIDLARPKNNKNGIMFTPEERAQIDKLVDLGFVDTFRLFSTEGGNYSWWPYFANAREKNIGWRIDYIFTSKSLAAKVKSAGILNKITGSDHCPVSIDFS